MICGNESFEIGAAAELLGEPAAEVDAVLARHLRLELAGRGVLGR